jgi:iron complex transport system permease protein
MFVAAVLCGAAVSFAGLLGFVGLIVPHAARFLAGSETRRLLPVSVLAGGTFVIVCDILARVLFAPYELPVGIVMSFVGGPFFLWLLIRRKGGHTGHD